MNSSGCVYMPGGAIQDFNNYSITGSYYQCLADADAAFGLSQALKESLQQLKQTVMKQTQKPFEMQITFPATRSDIFMTSQQCATVEVGVVSVERAKEIYDVIGRQLAGLRATEPKKPAKKTKPKAKRK